MTDTPERPLRDEDIEAVGAGQASGQPEYVDPLADTDTTDAPGGDGGGDTDGTDSGDADGTDADSDTTDADTDTTDADADGTDSADGDVVDTKTSGL